METKSNKINIFVNIIIAIAVIVGGIKIYNGFTTLSKAECRNALSVKYSKPTQRQKDLITRCKDAKND